MTEPQRLFRIKKVSTKINVFLILKVILIILGLELQACKSDSSRSTDTLTVALGAPPFSTDPLLATDASGMRLVSLIYQGLVKIGSDLKPSPDLAYKWKVEKKNYTFYIKKNTKFSDGSPIKCRDIERSIKAYQSDKTPFKSAFSPIQNTTCTDNEKDIVFRFSLSSPSAKFLVADLPVLKIFKNQLGTGAFKLQNKENLKYTLSPNDYYKEVQPYNLELNFLKDDFARFLKTYKGEIDVAPNSIPFEKVNSFHKTKFKIIERPSLSTSYLLINHKNENLKDKNFRQVLYNGIGIEDIIKNRFNHHVTLAKSLLTPEHPYFAKPLLDIKVDAGKRLNLTRPLKLKTSNARQSIETGKIIAQKLRDIGIPTQLQSFEWGTFYRDIKSGNYDLALMKWVGVVDPDQYNVAFHSDEFPPGRNRGFYKDKTIDELLKRSEDFYDFSSRKKIYDEIQIKIFNDLAIIPLWHENQIHIIHPRIKYYTVNPMGDFTSLLNLKIKDKTRFQSENKGKGQSKGQSNSKGQNP